MRSLLCSLLLFGTAATAHADAMSCGSNFAVTGDAMPAVLLKCGPPALQQHRDEQRGPECNPYTVAIDTLTYNFGPQSFVRILTFVDGTLQHIEAAGYGS